MHYLLHHHRIPFSITLSISLASLHYQIHSSRNLLFTPSSQTRITPGLHLFLNHLNLQHGIKCNKMQQNIEWHSGRSPRAYDIVQPNVEMCYGCGAEFADKFRHHPNNLIVKHLDKRVTGKNSDGQLVYSTDFSNTTLLRCT